MLKVLSSILCDLDPKVKVLGQKAGICDGVPSTSALVFICVDTLTIEVRKLSDVLGSQVGKIIDFIIRGFLLMLRLRNNGIANKQLYGPCI